MSIYLGDGGFVELQRESLDVRLTSRLDPDDVNADRRRFSFDFEAGVLITGDRLAIGTIDGSTLELVAGHVYPDGLWYIHVDEAGGIRLYDNFADSLSGNYASALDLVVPTAAQDIYAELDDVNFRCIAKVQEYSISTTRETMDLTELGVEFRRQYANGLISGQGTLSCFWEYQHRLCDDSAPGRSEVPHYLARLILRTQIGGSFVGRFFLHSPDGIQNQRDYLWYEAKCIITNCAMAVSPTQPVTTQIEFVTTGQFRLNAGQPPAYLLQESGDLILQEGGSGILLEND